MGKVVPIIGAVLLVVAALLVFFMHSMETSDSSEENQAYGIRATEPKADDPQVEYRFKTYLGGYEQTTIIGENATNPGTYESKKGWFSDDISDKDGVSSITIGGMLLFFGMIAAVIGAIGIVVGIWTPRIVGIIGGVVGIVAFLMIILGGLLHFIGMGSYFDQFFAEKVQTTTNGHESQVPYWGTGMTVGMVGGILAVIGGGMGMADPKKEKKDKRKKSNKAKSA